MTSSLRTTKVKPNFFQIKSKAEDFFGWIGFISEWGFYYSQKFILSSFLSIQKISEVYQKPTISRRLFQPLQQCLTKCNLSISECSRRYQSSGKQIEYPLLLD